MIVNKMLVGAASNPSDNIGR